MSGDERHLTERLARIFPADPRRVPLGIGDDAAVVRHAARLGVVCCDPVVEGVHFDAGTPLELVGRKVVNRNLSDIAAMGAIADHALVSVLFSARAAAPPLRNALFRGIRAAATAGGLAVVGGDVSRTPGPLTVTVTVLGHAEGRVLRRDAARAGDALHVTGPLGGAALGHHLRFRPRLAEGAWLARQRGIGGCIDVSDGFLLDLWTMLRASEVPGALVFAAALPIRAAARRLAARTGRTPLDHALGDGEDHELLFTRRVRTALAAGGPLTARARRPIGILRERRGLWLVGRDGRERRVDPAGYQHDV